MNTNTSTNQSKLTQEQVNAAWKDIISQWDSYCPCVYLTANNHPEFWCAHREYKFFEATEPPQWISDLHKDEALMFYAFVILAEELEIPS